jgi:serine/threonine protein kinase/Tol biopolymer transport system component/tetratricopeptide (TPR) repeat protein
VTAERWEHVKTLFESALGVDPGDRPSFLERECQGDEELLREVSSLLDSHDATGQFMESPVASLSSPSLIAPLPPPVQGDDPMIGQRLGAYQLVKEIGRGGMGAVYLAIRADNEFRKRVAIKLIRGGMESEFVIKRFRHERQILARLEHPNIARLIDGGTTAAGLPYFVMEYAEGEPLTRYCESRSIAVQQRLEIFLRACSAVHYAHRRMIIHRDLKPGNILVKDDGTPKLLDFGIAKLMDPDTSDNQAETTMAGYRIVTPAYASPEQMRGEPATVRSDIYALGIILFELVTGKRPSSKPGEDPLRLPPAEGAEDDSTRLLVQHLRTVVHRAVQPDPNERYETVEALTADIRRCMSGVAIPNYAAAPTAMEAISGPSPGSIAVLPFKLLGTDSTSDGYLGLGITDALITKLSNVGRISVRSTSAVMKYASIADPVAAGRELGVESVLEGRVQKIGDRVRVTVQLVQVQTGAPVWAASFDEQFEDLLRVEDSISEQVAQALVPQLTGEERESLARAGTSSAKAHQAYLRGRWHWNKNTEESLAQALVCFMQAIAEDPQYARAHAGVADYYVQLGIRGGLPPAESFAAAKEAANTALRIDPSLAEAHASLGFAIWAHERDAALAAHHFQLAIALHPDYAPAHHWLGLLNSARRRPDMAIACVERARKLDPNRAILSADLALCYYHARRYEEAAMICERSMQTIGEDSELFATMALSYIHEGDFDKALHAARRAADLTGEDIFSIAVLAEVEAAQGYRSRARTLLKQVQDIAETRYVSGCVLALLHIACNEKEKALDQLERAWRDHDWWVVWLPVGPSWDPVRKSPRFQQLLALGDVASRSWPEPPPAASLETTETAAPAPAHRPSKSRRSWMVAAAVLFVALAAAFLYRWMRVEQVPFQRPQITKITTDGTAFRAAISPDGRFIAYTSGREGRGLVWVRELRGASAYRVAGPYSRQIRSLEFIKGGREVTFIVLGVNEPSKNGLYSAAVGGGEWFKLMEDVPTTLSVSPDGSRIAFYRANRQANRDELVLAKMGGGAERIIATQRYPDRFNEDAYPIWSPDGLRLACGTEGTDSQGYRVVPAIYDLNGRQTPVKSPRFQYLGRMSWIRNNAGLMAIGQEQDGSFQQIWWLPAKAGEPARISNDLNDYQSLAVSADGSSMVSVQISTLTNLYLMDARNPAKSEQITPGGGRYFDLNWSPDGKIVYASDASGAADIWMMNADGTGQKMLTSGAGRSYSPAVSPDGKTIAYHSNRGGNWNIWKMDREDRTAVQLTSGTRDSNWPQFTKDGGHLIYHHTGVNAMFNLWRTPIAGGAAEQITKELTMHPAVSRKSGLIACWYASDVSKPVWKIAILNADGSGPVKMFDVAASVRYDSMLRWTPDGSGIAYVDDRNSMSNIWIQPVNGGGPEQLTKFTWGQIYSFDWAGENRIVYSRGMSTSDVVLIREKSQAAASK